MESLYEEVENTQDGPTLVALLQETALFLWKDWPRNMETVGLNAQGNFSLSGACPHCNHASVFIAVTNVYLEHIGNTPQGQQQGRLIAAMQCQGCKRFILGIVTHIQNQMHYAYESHYPLGKPDDTVADEIPEHIKPDFKEALRCLWINAYNATGEMCRRALEASCLDLGAPHKDVLEDMIDWLEEHRIITPSLKDVAHKVRLGGNRCAHPTPQLKNDGIEEQRNSTAIDAIGEDHAKAIVDFTRHFFQYVYVTPRQLLKYDFTKATEGKK